MFTVMSDEHSSVYRRVWACWDNAWDIGLPQQRRIDILKNIAAPTFVYSNGAHIVRGGNLSELAQLIERLLQEAGNNLKVKHIKWWEHHQQSALQWDMIHVDTEAWLLRGFSHASYDDKGKLLSVTDLY